MIWAVILILLFLLISILWFILMCPIEAKKAGVFALVVTVLFGVLVAFYFISPPKDEVIPTTANPLPRTAEPTEADAESLPWATEPTPSATEPEESDTESLPPATEQESGSEAV